MWTSSWVDGGGGLMKKLFVQSSLFEGMLIQSSKLPEEHTQREIFTWGPSINQKSSALSEKECSEQLLLRSSSFSTRTLGSNVRNSCEPQALKRVSMDNDRAQHLRLTACAFWAAIFRTDWPEFHEAFSYPQVSVGLSRLAENLKRESW